VVLNPKCDLEMITSTPKSLRTADIRNKLQLFFTILEKLDERDEVSKKTVSRFRGRVKWEINAGREDA